MYKKNFLRRSLFWFTLCITLFFHIGGIYLLQGMSIENKFPMNKGRGTSGKSIFPHSFAKQLKKEKKREALALFQHLESGKAAESRRVSPLLENLYSAKDVRDLSSSIETKIDPYTFSDHNILMPDQRDKSPNSREDTLFSLSSDSLSTQEDLSFQPSFSEEISAREEELQWTKQILTEALHSSLSTQKFSSREEEHINLFAAEDLVQKNSLFNFIDQYKNQKENSFLEQQKENSQDLFSIHCSFIADSLHQSDQKDQEYFFRIEFVPHDPSIFQRIRQNFFFLIDRSQSIQKHRFLLTKRAVARCLHMLHPEDQFNILFFDEKVNRMDEGLIPVSRENISRAIDFLKSVPYGSFFSSTDLRESLKKTIPEMVANEEINTAILFSDGDPSMSVEKQKQLISEWTEANRGKVSLFTITSGKRNQFKLLSFLSNFNKGIHIHMEQHEHIKKALYRFIRSVENPIAKNMSLHAISLDQEQEIQLYPQYDRLPHLYSAVPYIIYGKTNKLKDFHLFFQGLYYDKWVDIRQTIPLSTAMQGKSSIALTWVKHQAYENYHQYFIYRDEKALKRATASLSLCNLPVPYEQAHG